MSLTSESIPHGQRLTTVLNNNNNNGPETPQDNNNNNININNNNHTPDSPENDEEKRAAADLSEKKTGRRKINIEFIEDKSRRHITFSKRKAGIMKKAYELSTLTGTQVLLLVASETGHVYTFATPKLQPLITKAEGKNLIQSCLNAQEPSPPTTLHAARITQGYNDASLLYSTSEVRENQLDPNYDDEKKVPLMQEPKSYPLALDMNSYQGSAPSPYPPTSSLMSSMYSMPSMSISRGYPYSPAQYAAPPSNQGQYSTHPNQYSPYGNSALPPAPWSKSSSSHNMQLNPQNSSNHAQQSPLMQNKGLCNSALPRLEMDLIC